ncbi:MAG: leucyl/phenylalanyl-tRNA--protein transferase [Bacteroidetes bacterium]|nr:leucyl/phenylalanyl-tRNA--protein transferase [Bacteroidota bacterium]
MKKQNQTLTTKLLFSAYCQGIFPMAAPNGNINWYSPDPRAIIPIEKYKPTKSLRSVLNKNEFEIRINQQFEQVMRFCSLPRYKGDGIWISEEMIQVYSRLNELGFAHSVEAYQENKLVGGLYGVQIGSVFFGESMYTLVSNASKVAFHWLIQILRQNEFDLLDSQFMNDNVRRYGAIEIPRDEFIEKLEKAIVKERRFIL